MNRIACIITAALLSALATSCATRNPKPSPFQGPTRTLQPDGTVIDNSGKTAAGSGAVLDTTDAIILPAFAEKIHGNEWTLATATLSMLDEPNVNDVEKLEVEHKATLSSLASMVPGSSPYAAGLAALESIGGKIVDARAKRANAAKADASTVKINVLSVGAGHQLAPIRATEAFEGVLKSRHQNQGTFTRVDEQKIKDAASEESIKALLKTIGTLNALSAPVIPPAVAPVEPPIVFPELPPATNTTGEITFPGLPQ